MNSVINGQYTYWVMFLVTCYVILAGTHVAIKAPSVDEAIYINRKRYHSLNVQAVCDAHGLILNYSARFPGKYSCVLDNDVARQCISYIHISYFYTGSTHDAYVWNQSQLRQHFLRGHFGDYLLLGMYTD